MRANLMSYWTVFHLSVLPACEEDLKSFPYAVCGIYSFTAEPFGPVW